MASDELIQGLNEQFNREVTTLLGYMIKAASIKGIAYEPVRAMYLAEATDEVEHAQYLANQIVMLGGVPQLHPDLTPPSQNVLPMLEHDVEEEKLDVKNYMLLAALAEKDGLFALKMAMERQAADEDEHGQEMRRLLG